jgi:TPR repeat protein
MIRPSKRAEPQVGTIRNMPAPETVLEHYDGIIEDDTKKAEEGGVDAMRRLADWYGKSCLDGFVPPIDEKGAKRWRNRATVQELKDWASASGGGNGVADAPDPRWAMFELGNVFLSGEYGVEKDSDEAHRWFKRSADAGYPAGLAGRGLCKLNGWGTNKNVTSGLALVSSAARDGSDLACFVLGECFYKCKYGNEKDIVQAQKWLTMAVGDGGEEECSCRVLDDEHLSQARKWLEEIERLREQEEIDRLRGHILV